MANFPEEIVSILATIEEFNKRCEEEEHTDTNEAWQILHGITNKLAPFSKAEKYAKEVISLIKKFEKECSKNEWTDTDELWNFFDVIIHILRLVPTNKNI